MPVVPSAPTDMLAATSTPDAATAPKMITTALPVQTSATIAIYTRPTGAKVFIDGDVLDALTPVRMQPVTAGPHHVVIERGSDHEERDIDLQFGEPGDVVFSLSGTPGRLYVFGAPTGALVAIDNITVGVAPVSVDVAAGPHTVRVSAAGYTPYETAAQIESGQSTRIEARLPHDLSTLDLGTNTDPTRLAVKYALGAVGGADLASGDPTGLAELAIGSNQYEGVFRLGRANGATQFDALFRWTLLPTVVSPFLAAGYSGGGIGSGYLVEGGLRWDLDPDGKVGFSILAAIGASAYSKTSTASSGATTGANYPLELIAEVRFR